MSDIYGLWVEIVKKIFFAVRRGQGMDSALFCCPLNEKVKVR